MGDEFEKRRREMHNLSIQTNNYSSSRDLFGRFRNQQQQFQQQQQQLFLQQQQQQQQQQQFQSAAQVEQNNEEIELNLGLSLGGRFGVDKNKLIRSSSIAGPIPTLREEGPTSQPPVAYPTLIRTSSLPTGAEEEWRKRKELQTLRRLEAKRRRSKKLRTLSSRTDKMDLNREEDDKRSGSCESSSPGSNRDQSNQEAAGSSLTKLNENSHGTPTPPLQRNLSVDKRARELGMNSAMDDTNMPCVFAKGDGPSGRRIEGILYKYGKGGEVRIMCVCHGSFFSAGEFVKHAGGGDVDHPLRHIGITPSPSLL